MWKRGTLVQQEAAASTGVFGVGAANWYCLQKTFNWYDWRLTARLTTSLLEWKRVEFSWNSRACSRRRPALRIPRFGCMLTHEADPGCAVHTNLLWTSLRQITATKLQHTLPTVNWLFAIAASAGCASPARSQSADSPSTSFLFPYFSLLFTTLTHVALSRNSPKSEIQSRGTLVLVASKRKATTSTNKQQVCRQFVKKSTSVQDFSGISVQTLRCKEARWLKAGDEGNMRKNKLWRSGFAKEAQHEASRWPTSDFPEEHSRNSSDK